MIHAASSSSRKSLTTTTSPTKNKKEKNPSNKDLPPSDIGNVPRKSIGGKSGTVNKLEKTNSQAIVLDDESRTIDTGVPGKEVDISHPMQLEEITENTMQTIRTSQHTTMDEEEATNIGDVKDNVEKSPIREDMEQEQSKNEINKEDEDAEINLLQKRIDELQKARRSKSTGPTSKESTILSGTTQEKSTKSTPSKLTITQEITSPQQESKSYNDLFDKTQN
jgi:hypothetical protein